jgi:hypothetical protein
LAEERLKGGDETGALAKVEAAEVKVPGPSGAPREPAPVAAPEKDEAGPATQRSAPGA